MTTEPVASDLKDYLSTLRREARVIIATTIAVLIVAILWVRNQAPVYSASAEVLVEPLPTSSPALESGPLVIENEARIATSSRVVSAVREVLAGVGLEPAATSVEAPIGVSTLVFTSESSNPRAAWATADAYARTYLSERLEVVVGEVAASREEIESRIEDLSASIEEKRDALLRADTTNEIDVLGVELDTLTSQLLSEQARLDEIPDPSSIRVGEVLHPAVLPTEPSNRALAKVGLVAAFLGVSLGIGLALMKERLARPITSRPDLEAAAGAPLAAMVPPFEASDGRIAVVAEPRSPAADAFRVLAARVGFAMTRQSIRTLLITGPERRSGKTTTAVNLAAALAGSGRKVTLVLADMHKSAPPGLLTTDEQLLSEAVSGQVEAVTALRETSVPNLTVLGNARPAPDAGGVVASDAMRRVITELEKETDIVVIDTAPVLGPSDAFSLASFVDAVLLVAHTQLSTLSRLEECAVELRSVDSIIVGVVLTGVTARTFHPYGDRTIYYALGEPGANGARVSEGNGAGGPTRPDAARDEPIGSSEPS